EKEIIEEEGPTTEIRELAKEVEEKTKKIEEETDEIEKQIEAIKEQTKEICTKLLYNPTLRLPVEEELVLKIWEVGERTKRVKEQTKEIEEKIKRIREETNEIGEKIKEIKKMKERLENNDTVVVTVN